ncbi:MAG: site-specific integrase [Desulfobacteraceae bacterium]
MVFKQVFKCQRTLNKLQAGPLAKILEEFCQWLLDEGFARDCIRKHLSNVSHFNKYFERTSNRPSTMVTAKNVEGFFKVYPSLCRNRGPLKEHLRRVRHSINRFTAYLDIKGLFDPLVQTPIYQALLDDYLTWLRNYQHATEGTLAIRAQSITRFLQWLGPEATVCGLAGLTPERIETFFLSHAQVMGRSKRRSMQSALRTFLRFGLQQGFFQHRLDRAVPTLHTYKLSTVPRALTEEQTQRVIGAVDAATDSGRRDYAILQLLHTYGVRGGQLRALQMEDVHWADNQILFRASKHGKDSLLPLSVEVGQSLLDYLRYARPHCSYPQIFLTCRAPYHPLTNSRSLSAIVERHIRTAGIDVTGKGSHAFRHGFATRMVNKGHSLKEVADVLGHRHLSTTFIYTKVDFNALKQVALDWPEELER